ncbi:MAG: type II secretion system F family protein [Thermoproteota archaeon]
MEELLVKLGERIDPELRYRVIGSGISRSLDRYARRYSAAALPLVVAVSALASLYARLVLGAGLPVCVVFAAGVAGSALTIAVAAFVGVPLAAYSMRASKLDPRFLLFATALALRLYSGLGMGESFVRMYEEDREELPEFRVELEYIASRVRAGESPEKVLADAAKVTPSRYLKGLFSSLSGAFKTGVGLRESLEAYVSEFLMMVEVAADEVSQSLGSLLELFIAFSIMMPVVMGVAGLLLALYPVAGLSADTIIFITTFVVVPAVSASIAVLSDMIVSRVRM